MPTPLHPLLGEPRITWAWQTSGLAGIKGKAASHSRDCSEIVIRRGDFLIGAWQSYAPFAILLIYLVVLAHYYHTPIISMVITSAILDMAAGYAADENRKM